LKKFKTEMNYSTSKQLIKNTKNFLNIKHYSFVNYLFRQSGVFYGWGRKNSGLKAVELAKKHTTSFVLLEDGFIRSLGLGVEGYPSFSLVEDDVGIYYDATVPSKLENLLNIYDFSADSELMKKAQEAIELIRVHNISKYNNAPKVDTRFQSKFGMTESVFGMTESVFGMTEGVSGMTESVLGMTEGVSGMTEIKKRVLVIAQTAGDASLKYGMLDDYTTDDMISSAISENPDATVYLKVHPDVLSGKKKSDIDINVAKKKCIIIEENINPISLLKYFDKVYTKTSGMGFEALLVGCECVCFGMPFYAGWGITDDRTKCERRKRVLSVEEVFAAAYILYTRYYNSYEKRECDIFEVMQEIVAKRRI